MRLNRDWILSHIPHQGRMCLLDEVVSWDAERISCRAATHHATDNPLRVGAELGIACGIEYAAQAMALHGALAGDRWPGGVTSGDHVWGPVAAAAGTPGAAASGDESLGSGTPAAGMRGATAPGATAPGPDSSGAGTLGAGSAGAVAPPTGVPGVAAPGPSTPAAGYLAGLRGVEFHVLRLDELPGDLLCEAVKVAGDGGTALYDFELRSGAKRLLRGRATVLLEARERIHP